ncbi:MerR family transcriptional regulator [Paracoccaceae bacterium]|nr:MerR family transcriptional regulator [Paracoccaceae bacterium]
MVKSADAFRTIREVSDVLKTPAHVLRFWESKFSQIKPIKRAGGRRYYRRADIELISGIKKLLHDDGITIRGVQKILREQGVKHVASLQSGLDPKIDSPTVPSEKVTKIAQRLVTEHDALKSNDINKLNEKNKSEISETGTQISTKPNTDAGTESTPRKAETVKELGSQISLFDDLPISPNPAAKVEKSNQSKPTAPVAIASIEPDTNTLNDNELVPEIAAQLAQNTPNENRTSATEMPKPGTNTASREKSEAVGAGPLHYLADISDLRPGQEEALPKLRDRLKDIFPNPE